MKIPTNVTRNLRLLAVVATLLSLEIASLPAGAQPQTVRSGTEAARVLVIENLTVQEGIVTGEVRNKSDHAVRDVQLFIRYTWLWADERHPGKVDPGTSTYYALKETIEAGNKVSFVYKPSPPLPRISGGRFETSVMIAGFTEIIPQSR
jgi:hypothetical protein